MTESISGIAAGVPFTALPPSTTGPAPLLVSWHLMDAPCTDAAFAAALPMTGLNAWRVHLGLPMCGARTEPGGRGAIAELARKDIVLSYLDPIIRQAADEFPLALAELRARFPIADAPLAVLGGSLGGAVALLVLAESPEPIAAAAVVNAGIRARSVTTVVESGLPDPYVWSEAAEHAADSLDFVARAGDIAVRDPQPAVLVVSGELDHPPLRTDAIDLAAALHAAYRDPERVRFTSVPDLAHPLAVQPGIDPAPQTPTAVVVDAALTGWFQQHWVQTRLG